MPNVYVARHGETNWNREGRYQGQRESQLTELGKRQAAALASALARENIARVVSSPLERCVETARPIAHALGLTVECDPLLLEIAHGTWEGRLRDDIERDDAQTFAAWRRDPASVRFADGESLRDVLVRWRDFVASIAGGADVAVVTHDVLVRLAILDAGGRELDELWEPRVANGGFALLCASGGRWSVVDECRDAHLAGMFADASRQAL